MRTGKHIEHRRDRTYGLLAGLLLGMCVMLIAGAVSEQTETTGRYQCCAAGQDSMALFVIDTVTGQTWRLGRSDHYDYGTPEARRSVRSSQTPLVR